MVLGLLMDEVMEISHCLVIKCMIILSTLSQPLTTNIISSRMEMRLKVKKAEYVTGENKYFP